MREICVECQVEMKVQKTGVVAVELFNNPPEPYKLWNADLYKCPVCGREVVGGFADRPFAMHDDPDFANTLRNISKRSIFVFER